MPYLRSRPVAVSEGAGTVTFVVELDAPVASEVRVSYGTDIGSATYGGSQDFVLQQGTLIFAPGETAKSIQVTVADGTTPEATEVFWLDLSSPVNATVQQRWTAATIFDNDGPAGTPAISVGDLVLDESDRSASFVISLSRPSTLPVGVNYSTADDTALAGLDYTAASGLLSFAPGEMVKTVTVNLIDDTLPEGDEFFQLVLSNPTAATLADATGVAMIGRNDTAPVGTPHVFSRPIAVGEGETFANFVVQLSAPSVNEVRINYGTDVGSATYGGSQDFHLQQGTLVFAPGETTKVVPVLMGDGTAAEATEVFWLDLSSPVNAVVPQRWTPGIIFDNDGATGTPAISVGDVVVDESAQTARFFVSLGQPSVSTVTVAYATEDDTALAGLDYTAASGLLSFAPGEMVKTVTVNLIDDTLPEGDEFFALRLSQPTGATLADAVGAAMIGRNDTPPVSTPQIFSTPVAVSEADTFATFVVQLSAPARGEIRVNYGTDIGTATYGNSQDFHLQQGTLVFAPGETTRTVQVLLGDGTVAESTEAFTLDLASPVGATVPQRFTTATIYDNDGPGTVYSRGISNDLYVVGSVLDRVVEGPRGGIDTVQVGFSYTLPDHVENLVLTGSALNGIGNTSGNVFRGTPANNVFDGKEGNDTVVFSGLLADYTLSGDVAQRTVGSFADGTDTLFSIERLQFADTVLASDTTPGGHTWGAYAMFNAGFDTGPDIAQLSLWTAYLDRVDGNLQDLAQAMINHYAPGVSDEALVTHLWGTIVGTPIPIDQLQAFVGLVADGTYTQASLLEYVTTIDLNTVELVGIVGQTLSLDPAYFPPPG